MSNIVMKQTEDWKKKIHIAAHVPGDFIDRDMQSQIESDRLSLRTNLITTDRPDSSQVEKAGGGEC